MTSDARIPAITDQPTSVVAEALNPPSSTSFSNACHHSWPATRFRAWPVSMDATSARRMFDSSSLGTVTYCAIRRLIDRERTSNAVRIAKTSSASTDTITKTMRNGERITRSIQPLSNVPLKPKRRLGLVYVAVAAGSPATVARTVAFVSGGSSDV